MTKLDIINQVAVRMGLLQFRSEHAVGAPFNAMKGAMERGEQILQEIEGIFSMEK